LGNLRHRLSQREKSRPKGREKKETKQHGRKQALHTTIVSPAWLRTVASCIAGPRHRGGESGQHFREKPHTIIEMFKKEVGLDR